MRRDITFNSQGARCAGWLYLPDDLDAGRRLPGIVLGQGFSCVKEMQGYMTPFASAFAAAGFAALVFDYRFLGASEGEPRAQVFPAEQQKDIKNAVSFLAHCDEVDQNRIGLWGTSYAGAHVLQVVAFDRRVRAVVSQVPLVHGWRNAHRLIREDHFDELVRMLERDREERYATGAVNYYPVVAPAGEPCILPTPPSYDWFINAAKTAPLWENRVTMESLEAFLEYVPQAAIDLVSPTPLLMVVGDRDILTPTDLALQAYSHALPPKRCVTVKGGHFAPYEGPGQAQAIEAAVAWFRRHL